MQADIPLDLVSTLGADVTKDEIKDTLFSLPDHKAPGPDGFTAHFFKKAWSIIGEDFIEAIASFFQSGKLLKAVNSTIIALVPKVPNPSKVTDFRPISCCSTIYKCISKILANRLKAILPHVINPSQAAFIKGRSISDQILLMHELVRNYHRQNLSPRCAMKIDLMKAFDSVSWDMLLDILHALKIPAKFQEWIAACITTPCFSISINGGLEGYFKGANGLRQGDPLSPYLFLLAMEFFSRLFNAIAAEEEFSYHPKCLDPLINHICFADDLFILCSPNEETFKTISKALLEFHKYSGLKPNGRKSMIYITGLSLQEKSKLSSLIGFQLGELPVKYLGVPLISTRLKHDDCKELIEKITKKVSSWSSKTLSYAGRLVLVKSVLFSIQVYWRSHFILPKKVCNSIEQILRRYLWTGAELKKWGNKVAWNEVCLPKNEGGLGLKKIHEWNKATLLRHLWALCSNNPSLWVKWCKSNLLKGKCFWEVKIPGDCSWNWRKLLKLREIARFISRYKVGNGDSISLWFSNWHPQGPLIPKYTSRVAYDAGLPLSAKVSKVIKNGQWHWPYPNTWELREIILEKPPNYMPNSQQFDQFIWTISKDGAYNAAATWEETRVKGNKVNWHSLVWFSNHIPRHSFILWLAIKERLPTKDKLLAWGMNVDPSCALCGVTSESMEHIFFQCSYSAKLRESALLKCSINKRAQPWRNELAWAVGKFSGKSLLNIDRKLTWAALIYHLWKERNTRIFGGPPSTTEDIIKIIGHEVKIKLSQHSISRNPNVNTIHSDG